MFDELSIETVGSCNRTCPTCERNSYPNREAVAGRFGKQQRMPEELFYKVVDDAVAMGFTGAVNLQHYNEPLQDPRIAVFAQYVRSKNTFREVYMHSNADLLTERKAKDLDGVLNRMIIALYDETGGQPLPLDQTIVRRSLIRSWFKKTRIDWATAEHVYTHYSPYAGLQAVIDECRPMPCRREVQMRMIIDYRGEMLLCCDDIVGLWKLGNATENTLEELWFSDKHQEILRTLEQPGGREAYGFCRICPRPDTPWSSTLEGRP